MRSASMTISYPRRAVRVSGVAISSMADSKLVWLLGVLVVLAAIGLLMLCRELQNAVLARKEVKEARTLVHKKP